MHLTCIRYLILIPNLFTHDDNSAHSNAHTQTSRLFLFLAPLFCRQPFKIVQCSRRSQAGTFFIIFIERKLYDFIVYILYMSRMEQPQRPTALKAFTVHASVSSIKFYTFLTTTLIYGSKSPIEMNRKRFRLIKMHMIIIGCFGHGHRIYMLLLRLQFV